MIYKENYSTSLQTGKVKFQFISFDINMTHIQAWVVIKYTFCTLLKRWKSKHLFLN